MCYKRFIYLNTNDRISTSTNSKPKFKLPEGILYNNSVIKLSSGSLPYSFYQVITGSNDTVLFTESGEVVATATLDPGTYTGGQLATQLKTQLEVISPDSRTYTVTYDSKTLFFTIVPSAGTVIIEKESTAASLLGFSSSADSSDADSVTSVNASELEPINTLFVCSNTLGSSKSVSTNSNFNILAKIDITSDFGERIVFSNLSKEGSFFMSRPISFIDFFCVSDTGVLIDFRDKEWKLCLEINPTKAPVL